jgi:hypothetical protein
MRVSMASISEFEQDIRKFINSPRKQFHLLKDAEAWNRLCSSLDVIGDTQLAIDAYLEKDITSAIGGSYLIVYGILQVMIVQQDAVKSLAQSLSINCQFTKNLNAIRGIRSDSIGHPTKQREDKRLKSNFIVRMGLSEKGFNLMTVYSDRRPYILRYIEIPSLITEQRSALEKILTKVVERLTDEEMVHKEQFRNEKLEEAFPPTLGYYFEKIFEATRGGNAFLLGGPHLTFIAECLDQLEQLLKERGLLGVYDSISYHMDLARYPLEELMRFFQEPASSKLNDKDAYIFASFLEAQINYIKGISAEIDDEYSSNL